MLEIHKFNNTHHGHDSYKHSARSIPAGDPIAKYTATVLRVEHLIG
jgi:hypothetical protein